MGNQTIYLDHNATTITKNTVIEVIAEIMKYPYNASSVHHYGQIAKKILEDSRQKIAESINSSTRGIGSVNIVFTSNGTEANNMVLKNYQDDIILISAIEHPSIINLVDDPMHIIKVDDQGILNLEDLEDKLKSIDIKENKLVSVMLVNNETGVIQPINEIARIVHKYNGIMHVDAIQALGKIPVDFYDLDADIITICGHKIGGPPGIAALIFKKAIHIKPLLTGGGQEFGFRAGTEPLALIAGFAKSCELLRENLLKQEELKKFQEYIESTLLEFDQNLIIVGQYAKRVANTICIINPNVSSETQLIQFDLKGFCLSNGSACSSGRVKKSYVLSAMGYNDDYSSKCLRISMGHNTNFEEIKSFVNCWKEIYSN